MGRMGLRLPAIAPVNRETWEFVSKRGFYTTFSSKSDSIAAAASWVDVRNDAFLVTCATDITELAPLMQCMSNTEHNTRADGLGRHAALGRGRDEQQEQPSNNHDAISTRSGKISVALVWSLNIKPPCDRTDLEVLSQLLMQDSVLVVGYMAIVRLASQDTAASLLARDSDTMTVRMDDRERLDEIMRLRDTGEIVVDPAWSLDPELCATHLEAFVEMDGDCGAKGDLVLGRRIEKFQKHMKECIRLGVQHPEAHGGGASSRGAGDNGRETCCGLRLGPGGECPTIRKLEAEVQSMTPALVFIISSRDPYPGLFPSQYTKPGSRWTSPIQAQSSLYRTVNVPLPAS